MHEFGPKYKISETCGDSRGGGVALGFLRAPQETGDGSYSSSSPFRPRARIGVSNGPRRTWVSNIPSILSVCTTIAVQLTGLSL